MPLKNMSLKYLMENPGGEKQICSETDMGFMYFLDTSDWERLWFPFSLSPSLSYFWTPLKEGFQVITYTHGARDVYTSPSQAPPPGLDPEPPCTGADGILASPLPFVQVVSASPNPVYSPGVSMGASFLLPALGMLSRLLQIPEVLRGLHLSTRLFIPHSPQLFLHSGSRGCLVSQANIKWLVARTLTCVSHVSLLLHHV